MAFIFAHHLFFKIGLAVAVLACLEYLFEIQGRKKGGGGCGGRGL